MCQREVLLIGAHTFMHVRIPIDMNKVRAFCEKWQIEELALFGSVLRDDFGPTSDVDVLVRFAPDSPYSVLLDHCQMEDELERIFGRSIDLISKRGVEQSKNERRRVDILTTAEVIYAKAA